ncbi:MAG: XRE family transcriptional regulator [Spirochaetaceae bacterium]|jgi:DNA-binding transcriptional regulator YiaG|nr:XRE family transcriptional regulator [Spirochaetaceae bacterium]
MKKKYQSEQLMVIHDMAKSLYKIGAIDDAKMREFDTDCLVSTPGTAGEAATASEPAHSAATPAGAEHLSSA